MWTFCWSWTFNFTWPHQLWCVWQIFNTKPWHLSTVPDRGKFEKKTSSIVYSVSNLMVQYLNTFSLISGWHSCIIHIPTKLEPSMSKCADKQILNSKGLFTNDVGIFWGLWHPCQPIISFWPAPWCFKLTTSFVNSPKPKTIIFRMAPKPSSV